MSRVAYVDGQYMPHRSAAVHIEDRGYQFATGDYEVLAVVGGQLVDAEPHLVRLARALSELRIAAPMSDTALKIVMCKITRRNRVRDGIVYLRITRSVAPRGHSFPRLVKPVLVAASRQRRPADPQIAADGIAGITIPDIRCQPCDIKSVALLPNVPGKQVAKEAGGVEARQVDRKGQVTERPFTVAEAKAASEAFLTSTTVELLPVVRIDGDPVGNGKPGPLSRRLRQHYLAHDAAAAA